MTTTENRPKKTQARRIADPTTLITYLNSLDLGVTPTVKVNGHNYSMALVTVDFGTPLKPVKFSAEESQEFTDRLRKLAKDVIGRDNVNIRISNDSQNGVFWASV